MKNESICLFSSYFESSKIPFAVQFYLEQLRPHFSRIVFITNNDRELDELSRIWLAGVVDDVLFVKNEGYDFGMWQKAIKYIGDFSGCKRLGLINDSCICYAPLNDFFEWVEGAGVLAAGMVKSYEKIEHLQSYFLVFSGDVIEIAITYIAGMKIEGMSYESVVHEGELGLSDAILGMGFRLSARYESEQNNTENPSFANFTQLLDAGIPLIKRKLLSYPAGRNPLFSVWQTADMRREFYVGRILGRNNISREELLMLFSSMPPRNFRKEASLYVRMLKATASRCLTRRNR